ncbi:MAG: hypothetical protein Q4B69_08440 [Slackia sp.]|nr:hypothetical protein [Slackia sp.]
MFTTAVKTADAIAKKSLAVLMAVLLCMPMTGFEYLAFGDEETPAASATEADTQDGVESGDSLAGGGFCFR